MHYALRPWPWILVALASLVVFPDLASIKEAFPNIADDKLGHDLAYSAMLVKLPPGLMGLVLASLIAAYMSTISTQLNWGSSYIVYDFYQNQINPEASEKRLVAVGRLCTIGLMILSAALALLLQSALQIFDILLTFGAGTGLIFILRWFWWRINAWSEISAMFASGILSILLKTTSFGPMLFSDETGLLPSWSEYPFVVLVTSAIWITVTYMTPAEKTSVLRSFYQKIQPGGPGWTKVVNQAAAEKVNIVEDRSQGWSVPSGITAMLLGCGMIYGAMFATGYWIYGQYNRATIITFIAAVFAVLLVRTWKKVRVKVL
jgi:Na+/proline symporter